MRSFVLVLALLALVSAEKHALFVSGNPGWRNYCITSTICRGYDILYDNGFKPENIVYMGFDDVFEAKSNPFPGKIFTDASPGEGIDYSRCRPHMDYLNDEVSAELFMAVMTGDEAAAKKLVGKDKVRVLKTTADDDVFVYYMDHGSIGSCAVGKTSLKETVLQENINKMYTNKQYRNLVFYFEACHSGSMFRSLPAGKNVYAFTGSDVNHSAWMNNCPPNDKVNGKSMGTCLGAWYDNFWMQEIDDHGSELTHNQMYKIVHDLTAKQTDQNVSQYGDLTTVGEMKVSQFIGHIKPLPKSDTTRGRPIKYEDVPAHLAKWNAIRTGSYSAMKEYEEVIKEQIKNEVMVMKLSVSYFGEENSEAPLKQLTRGYNVDCVRDLIEDLENTCGYTTPLRDEHLNVFSAICADGYVNVNLKNVC